MTEAIGELRGTVPLGDGRTATATFDESGRCVAFEIRARKGSALTATDLRVAFRQLQERCRMAALEFEAPKLDALEERLAEEGIVHAVSGDPRIQMLRAKDTALWATANYEEPMGRKALDERLLLLAAQQYDTWSRTSSDPIGKLLQSALAGGMTDVTRPMVRHWIRKCRPGGLGYLTAAPGPGKHGGQLTPKAKRLLKDLADCL